MELVLGCLRVLGGCLCFLLADIFGSAVEREMRAISRFFIALGAALFVGLLLPRLGVPWPITSLVSLALVDATLLGLAWALRVMVRRRRGGSCRLYFACAYYVAKLAAGRIVQSAEDRLALAREAEREAELWWDAELSLVQEGARRWRG